MILKEMLMKKGKEINDKLVNEFRNQNLMKNIFGLIRLNCEKRKAKKNIYEKNIINKKINKEKEKENINTIKIEKIIPKKEPEKTHISAPLAPGQVVILLSGRFRGRRVVFLKILESGLLLVTGPYKYNGVPLKRVNAAYVLPTNTKLKVDAKLGDKINDDFFQKVDIERKSEKDFLPDAETIKKRVTKERSDAQNEVDTVVKKAVDEGPIMKEYLRNRFALKSGDKPHLMKF